nr:AAA family ATPase [Streptomyces sp. NBC_00899]
MPPVINESGPALRIRLLGGFRVERDGPVPAAARWRRHSAQVLVKLLAVAPGHRLHRGEVLAVCWPDADEDAATRSLRVALHAARHALEPELPPRASSAYLRTTGELLSLDPERVEVDVDRVESLAARSLRAAGPGRLTALEEAARALRGELLPEDRYADWCAAARDSMGRLRQRVLVALADAATADGAADRAVEVLRELLDAEPLAEAAHLALMRVFLSTGQRRRALAAYHACRDVLAAELGVRPGPEIEELHQQALTTPTPAPAPASPAASPPGGSPAAFPMAARPLRGRVRVLAELTAPTGPAVLVSGEAGIGKTRLVAEAARRADESGAAVLWGAGHEAEGQTPYGAFVDALDGYVASRPEALRAVLGAEYPELAALLPALGAPPLPPVAPEQERARLFRAVAALLAELSAARPALVVLDDLHAADVGSAQLLHHLARVAAGRWRLIVTYRDDGLAEDDPRRDLFGRLAREGLAVRLELMRLPRSDCDLMVRDLVGGTAAGSGIDLDRLYRLSLGNPLFAVELARTAQEHGGRLPEGAGLDSTELPAAVRELVGARLASLPTAARSLVEILAVAGAGAPLPELMDVAAATCHPPISPAELTVGLDSACAAGIVAERAVHRDGTRMPGYSFRHPMVELVCGQRISGARRRQLHSAFADAVLRHRPGAVDAIVFHVREADDPRAVGYLWQAARRAARLYANDSALDYLEELVARLDAAASAGAPVTAGAVGGPTAADARMELAAVQRRTGRYAAAEETLTAALEAHQRAGDRDRALAAAAELGEVMAWSGRPQDGLDLLGRLPGPVRGSAGEPAAAYQLALMVLRFGVGHYPDALRAARAATALARPLETERGRRLLARGLGNQAVSLSLLGRPRTAWSAAREALPVAESTGDARLIADVAAELAELAQLGGRLAQAREYAERARSLAVGTGDRTAIVFKHANLGRLCLRLGDWAAAAREITAAEAASRELSDTWCRAYALANVGELRSWTGDAEGARACLADAVLLADRIGDHQARVGVRAILAELAVEHGDQGGPAEALRLLAGGRFGPEARRGPRLRVDPLRAWAYLAGGRPARAERLAGETVRAARAAGERLVELPARRVHGTALAALGRHTEAVRALNTAAEQARTMPYPYELARILTARAEARAAHDPRAAAADRAEAARIRDRLRAAAVVTAW